MVWVDQGWAVDREWVDLGQWEDQDLEGEWEGEWEEEWEDLGGRWGLVWGWVYQVE